jgi:type III pantothenate kinase
MKCLLLDAGNSALKWAMAELHASTASGTAALLPVGGALAVSASLDEALFGELQQWVAPPIAAAFGCSVADAKVQRAAENAIRRLFTVPVTWFAPQADFAADDVRLHNGYRTPTQLGADRWHAMLAARAAFPGRALMVVNAGTATTVDCITADGRFVGGVIAPGVRLMFDSLARQTAQLPVADGALVARPDNTDDAITSGVLESQIGLIERRVRRFATEIGAPVLVLLDGGNAVALRAHLVFDPALATVRHEQNLVLRGVLIRARAQG